MSRFGAQCATRFGGRVLSRFGARGCAQPQDEGTVLYSTSNSSLMTQVNAGANQAQPDFTTSWILACAGLDNDPLTSSSGPWSAGLGASTSRTIYPPTGVNWNAGGFGYLIYGGPTFTELPALLNSGASAFQLRMRMYWPLDETQDSPNTMLPFTLPEDKVIGAFKYIYAALPGHTFVLTYALGATDLGDIRHGAALASVTQSAMDAAIGAKQDILIPIDRALLEEASLVGLGMGCMSNYVQAGVPPLPPIFSDSLTVFSYYLANNQWSVLPNKDLFEWEAVL